MVMMIKKVPADKIRGLLSGVPLGLTIIEVVKLSGLSRTSVRIALARLEGAGAVSIKEAGMAKIYFLKEDDNE